jgi:hypothetical protein
MRQVDPCHVLSDEGANHVCYVNGLLLVDREAVGQYPSSRQIHQTQLKDRQILRMNRKPDPNQPKSSGEGLLTLSRQKSPQQTSFAWNYDQASNTAQEFLGP